MGRGGGGSRGKMLILLNVKSQNSYSPENDFLVCEISLNSLVKGHIKK